MKTRGQTLLLILCLSLAACQQTAPIVVVPPPTVEPTALPTPAPVRVYVSGAVATPGVYTLPPRSLVNDAIKAAGGPTSDADLERINLAQEVHDQQQIHVPRKGESAQPQPAPSEPGSTAATPGVKRVNINTATLAELDTLPKIGPSIAQRIIDYRTKNGPFKKIEDIKNVSGIGDATYEAIKDLITVEP
jgi:competence protein ComEA